MTKPTSCEIARTSAPHSHSLKFGGITSALICVVFLLGLSVTAVRIYKQYQMPGPFDASNVGFCDFHNGVYFPSLAFLDRISPYGDEYARQFPVARQIPLYSPSALILHLPFALLPLRMAEAAFFIYLIGLLLALAWLTLHSVGIKPRWQQLLLVASAIIYSRSGHNTLFNGYFTFELIIGTLLALHYGKSKPTLAALGVLLASGKPTYVIPLGILMIFRGHYRAVLLGGLVSAVVALAGFAWLASDSSVGSLIEDIRVAQANHLADPNEQPLNSWVRVDALAVFAKWTDWNPAEFAQLGVMSVLMLVPCAILFWLRKKLADDGAAGLIGAICSLTMMVALYHHFYDALVVIAPCAGLALCYGIWQRVGKVERGILLALMLIPLFNYSSSDFFIRHLDVAGIDYMFLTSINGVSLALALILVCVIAIKIGRNLKSTALGIE